MYSKSSNILSIFQNYYRLIAVDLSKQQELHADPNSIQQIDFNWKSN